MSTLQKISIVALSLVTMIGMSGVGHAVSVTDLQSMSRDQLLALLVQLLSSSTSTTTSTTGTTACTFTRNLYPGMSGSDVKCLQQYLNGAGYTIASSGAGSPGNESTYYGSLTQAAVKKWQDANGISYGSYGGYFGPSSRAKYSAIAVTTGGTTTTSTTTGTTTGPVVSVPSGTDLVVQVASDNPGAKVLGSGTSFNPVLKVIFAAGSKDVSINSLTLAKSGFVANTNINGVDVVDAQGNRYGNVITSINADNTIVIPFATPLVVKAGTSVELTFRVNLLSGNYNGTVSLALQSVSSTASNVSASFPIAGTAMNVVNGGSSIASTTLDVLTTTGSSSLNVDPAHLQEITRFRIQETSSNEDTKLYGLTLYNYGNADDTDYKDVTLEATDGTVLAVAQPSGQYVTFNLSSNPYLIGKGQTKDLIVLAKIVGGTTKTINLVVYNNYDIDLRGVSTGVSLLPGAGTNDSSFPIGNGFNIQTIGSGTMTFSRSATSPSGSVAPGATGVDLADFIAHPTGENYELRQVSFQIASSTGSANLTGTVYVRVNGGIVYSAAASTFTSAATTVTLSSYPILTAGQDNTISVSTDIPSTATSSSAYQVKSFDLIQAKRLVTGDLVDPGVTAQNGYNLTVSAASLTVTTLATPAANSVVAGTNGYVLASFSLNAGSGGENTRVTKIVVTHNGSSTVNTDLGNYKLYNDADGDGIPQSSEYIVTNDSQSSLTLGGTPGTNDTVTFTPTQAIVVTPSIPVTLILTSDVLSGAATGSTNKFNIASSGITASGAVTGNTVTPTYAGSGQAQTLVAAGNLTLSVLSGAGASPSVNQIVTIGSTPSVVFAFKILPQYEGAKITVLKLTASSTANGTLATTTLTNFQLYNGDPSAGGSLVTTQPQFNSCASGVCTVKFTANDNIFQSIVPTTGMSVYIKATVGAAGNAVLGDSFSFDIAATSSVSSTGASSATTTTVIGTPAASGYTYVVPQDVQITAVSPTAAASCGSAGNGCPSGTQLAVYKIYNPGPASVRLGTSTSFKFTQSGNTTSTFGIYTTASQNQTSGFSVEIDNGVQATSGGYVTLNISTSTAANRTVDGGSFRYIAIENSQVMKSGDTAAFGVGSLGDLKYQVDESSLGYDGNGNGTTLDTIQNLPIDGTPSTAINSAL